MGLQHANRILFKSGIQKRFLTKIMNKLNLSQRKFSNVLGVSRSTMRNWLYGKWLLPENILEKCLDISPDMKIYSKFIITKLPPNWGRIKGGKTRGKMKTNLNNKLRVKGFQKAKLLSWKRKSTGPHGERMYNLGEKRIAEILTRYKIKYQYEPLITLGIKYAFPDFLVRDIVIERCGYSDWVGYWSRIKKKFQLYNKYLKGNIIMIVPSNRFKIALRRVAPYVKNITIIKENEIELLPRFIMGL